MRASSRLRRAVCALVLVWTGHAAPAAAAQVLRSAEVAVTMPSPTSCQVMMTLVVDGGTAVDHRIESPDGTTIEGVRVQGAQASGAPRSVGSTQSMVLTPAQSPYTLSYSVQQSTRPYRCPLWIPTTPTDGVSRAVRIQVELPASVTPGSTMPRFTWNRTTGTAALAHLPAFVFMPYAAPGESPGWNVSAVMDTSAVSVFVVASAIWLWRRRQSR